MIRDADPLPIVALCSQWVTAGRIAWAFARDVSLPPSEHTTIAYVLTQGGVPFSAYFSKVDDRLGFPVRATLASFGFACIYGLLYLASTTAFNSIVTSAVLFLNITYVVPQGILLVQGRKKSLPARYLRLGYFGYFCNIFSVLFIVLLGVMVCMPPTLPVAIGTMNYTSVILVGLFAIILLCWFTVGRKFEGPHIQWDLINAANALATTKTSHA